MTGPSTAPHVTNEHLAGLLARTLPDDVTAMVRAHVTACATCSDRRDAMARVVAVARSEPTRAPHLAERVLATTHERGRRSSRERAAAALGIGALAAVVVLLLVTGPRSAWQARGGGPAKTELVARDASMRALTSGAVLAPPHALTVEALTLATTQPPFVVTAKDAAGRVTWLWPAWTDAAPPPACVDVRALALPARGPLVALPQDTPPGRVDIAVLAPAGACDVAAIDAALEAGHPVLGNVLAAWHVTLAP